MALKIVVYAVHMACRLGIAYFIHLFCLKFFRNNLIDLRLKLHVLRLENGNCIVRMDLSLNSGSGHISYLVDALF